MNKLHKILNWILNLILGLAGIACLWIIGQVFFFTSFRIPSDSMEPELKIGDCILVNKLLVGPRIFNLSASMREEQVDIYRMPGLRKVRRNDVLVFNFPHPHNWDKIEMHIMKYYIKRCVGLPGDTLSIENGKYNVRGCEIPLGNIESQKLISRYEKDDFGEGVFNSFPFDSILHWNIKDFGPLYIPKVGDSVILDRNNYCLYRKLIEWEQAGSLIYKDSVAYLDNKPVKAYRFLKNYYFMAGDKGENSQDSRYWGLLPEEYIVGKAWIIWKSVEPYSGKFRWNRFLKRIH